MPLRGTPTSRTPRTMSSRWRAPLPRGSASGGGGAATARIATAPSDGKEPMTAAPIRRLTFLPRKRPLPRPRPCRRARSSRLPFRRLLPSRHPSFPALRPNRPNDPLSRRRPRGSSPRPPRPPGQGGRGRASLARLQRRRQRPCRPPPCAGARCPGRRCCACHGSRDVRAAPRQPCHGGFPDRRGWRGMKFGIVTFPGSNCDYDAYHAVVDALGEDAVYLWRKDHDLEGADVVILPGGFSYGDYLRAGAIAALSPI